MTSDSTADLTDLLQYLHATRGFDFSVYKPATLGRRMARRMQTLGLDSYSEYKDYLEVHPDEFDLLFNTILINVTSFFRDLAAWDYLAAHVIPEVIRRSAEGEAIRVWSAGCSSGEEAYTVAMLFAEALGLDAFRERVKIYATDIDNQALTTARQATYGARALTTLPEGFLDRYFDRMGTQYAFNKELRRSVIFGRHDLTNDAPISRIDLLISRNTLMYFNAEAQTRILERFSFALGERGYLFLGKAETLLTHSQLFSPIDLKSRVFQRGPRGETGDPQPPPAPQQERVTEGVVSPLYETAIEADPIASLVIDARGAVAVANRQARELFQLPPESLGRPLQDLTLSYRPLELRSLIEESIARKETVRRIGVLFPTANDLDRWLDVAVVPLVAPTNEVLGVKITFVDVTRYHELQAELDHAAHALEAAYEELQSSNEELETTNEELQSTVEELETTNEELQATNEELETINEELESTNEELETVNAELSDRGDQLDETNHFLESILTSLMAGVIVLGRDLRVRSWNEQAVDLWGLRADEARGEHLLSLDFGLPLEDLLPPIREALNGAERYSTTLPATNRRGRAITCRVSLHPLRNSTQQIEGVIILIDDASGDRAAGL